jgi:hypothetical protein
MNKVLAFFCTLLLLVSPAQAEDKWKLDTVIDAYDALAPDVDVTIQWHECGFVNAWYFPGAKTVVLCEELKPFGPSIVRYVLAHEMAHAVIMQRDIPYTGSHEVAADELAALMLILIDREDDVLAGAAFWGNKGDEEDPEDDHPGDLRRAYTLECIVKTLKEEPRALATCPVQFRRVIRSWNWLLFRV